VVVHILSVNPKNVVIFEVWIYDNVAYSDCFLPLTPTMNICFIKTIFSRKLRVFKPCKSYNWVKKSHQIDTITSYIVMKLRSYLSQCSSKQFLAMCDSLILTHTICHNILAINNTPGWKSRRRLISMAKFDKERCAFVNNTFAISLSPARGSGNFANQKAK
jgi:hypothetical protein